MPKALRARAPITVYHVPRNGSWGRLDTYPANPTQAAHLFSLTGTRTLSHAQRIALEALGHTLATVPAPPISAPTDAP